MTPTAEALDRWKPLESAGRGAVVSNRVSNGRALRRSPGAGMLDPLADPSQAARGAGPKYRCRGVARKARLGDDAETNVSGHTLLGRTAAEGEPGVARHVRR